MRILMLTASLPYPPHQGGALRSYGLIHGLHQAGHEVALLSFQEQSNGSPVAETPLARYCSWIETIPAPPRSKGDRLRDLIFSDQPDIARRLYSAAFYSRLQQLLAENTFDLVQFEGIEVACYLPLIRRTHPPIKLCYDAFNAEAALQQVIFQVDRGDPKRWLPAAYSLVQSQRITHFERLICQQADCVLAVSAEDAAILARYRSDGHVPVVNNGIFVSDYATPGEQLDLGAHSLVFTGKMDYRPNVDAVRWFAESIFPQVQAQVSDACLYIVGQKPHPRLETLRQNRQIQITGWVRDVRPYLHSGGVYVAPLRMGSGTRLKILEAMASGCAVVATTIAASGMRPDAREAMIITDTPGAMAAAIVHLLQNPAQREQLGEVARCYVNQHYDWSVLIPRLLTIYKELVFG